MKFVKSLLIGLFISIVFCVIYSCSNHEENEYYKVETFTYEKSDACITTRSRNITKLYFYNMKLVDKNNDTVDIKWGSDRIVRFYPGDSIYNHYGNWYIKE